MMKICAIFLHNRDKRYNKYVKINIFLLFSPSELEPVDKSEVTKLAGNKPSPR